MARADAILNRLNTVLNKVGPQDRTVYKRVITRTGGDALIGRGASVSYADTILNPQPTYERLTRYIVGPYAKTEDVVQSGKSQVANSYMLTFSASAITRSDLENPNVQILLVDSSGNKESFLIDDYEPSAMNGVDLIYVAYIVSVKRP